jgi:hypothetical protein
MDGIKETDKWYRDGLYYEKIEKWKLGSTILTKKSRLFFVTYHLLRLIHGDKYENS